jgi:hypothetical protein
LVSKLEPITHVEKLFCIVLGAIGSVLIAVLYIVLGAIGSVLVATLAAWLQYRGWVHQNFEKRRDEQKRAATELALEVARHMDRRLYRQRRLVWATRSGNRIEQAQKEYREALFEWNDNYERIKAALWISFDRHAMLEFEEQIHNEFRLLG